MILKQHSLKISQSVIVILLTLGILSVIPMTISAQDTLSFSVNRNVGMAFGSYISGTYTINGNGPDTIDNLTVYFNDVEVHFVIGNTIAWQFNTVNYDGGATNITLIGITESGEIYAASQVVVFIAEAISTVVTIVIIALVIVLILAKYGPRLMRMRNK